MPTKTITIMEDAYELMARSKLPGESFTDTIRRIFSKDKSPLDFFGALKDVDTDEIYKTIKEGRELLRKRKPLL